MNKLKKSIENNIEIILSLLSIISILSGLFLSTVLIIKTVFFNYKLNDIEIKLAAILIISGLLGSVLDFVLKKYLKEYLLRFIDEGKLESLVEYLIEKNALLKEEEDERAEIDETRPTDDRLSHVLNAVIVPVAKTYATILQDKIYFCPSVRKFKDTVKYIAFYMNKKVVGWSEIDGPPIVEGSKKIYKLKKIHPLEIIHSEKGAFVQYKMYCNIDLLRNASDTSEIRPDIHDTK